MAKSEPVSTPGPLAVQRRDMEALKSLLRKHGPPTFQGARKRYCVGLGDNDIILRAAVEAVERGEVAYSKESVTLCSRAYWEMFDERE